MGRMTIAVLAGAMLFAGIVVGQWGSNVSMGCYIDSIDLEDVEMEWFPLGSIHACKGTQSEEECRWIFPNKEE